MKKKIFLRKLEKFFFLRFFLTFFRFYGDDRLEFLETVYTTDFAQLGVGQSALSMILNERGGIIDDSIMSNFGDHQ